MSVEKEITITPLNPKYDRHVKVEEQQLRAAAYCRVSTRFEQKENASAKDKLHLGGIRITLLKHTEINVELILL